MKLTRYEIRRDGVWSGALINGHLVGVIADDDFKAAMKWLPVPPKYVQKEIRHDEKVSFWFRDIGDMAFRLSPVFRALSSSYGEDFRVRTLVDPEEVGLEEVWDDEWQVALSEVLPDLPSLGDIPY